MISATGRARLQSCRTNCLKFVIPTWAARGGGSYFPVITQPPIARGLDPAQEKTRITARLKPCPPVSLPSQQELPTPHNLLFIHPDIKVPSHHINMCGRVPLRPSVFTIRITEGNVHPRILLILQDLPDHFLQFDISADGKLTHEIAVLVGVGIPPEVIFQLAIGRMCLSQPIALHPNSQRILAQAAKLRAEPVPNNAIDHECSIDFAWSGEHFAAGQVAPFVW